MSDLVDQHGHQIARATGGLYNTWGQLAANVGVPFATLLIVLFQLIPAINHGIQIADRVDGELNIVAQNCAVFRQPVPPIIIQPPAQP